MDSKNNFTCVARLEKLRSDMAVTWSELADLLGISRKYLFMIRVGTRHAGPSVERKIRELERDAKEQNGSKTGQSGGMPGTVREHANGYGMNERDQLLLNLAAENAQVKARLAEIETALKRMEEGRKN